MSTGSTGTPSSALSTARIVVVGSSLAGVRAAETLRRDGFDGSLTLVGKETHFPPYDRPPLSKQLLAGSWIPESARLKVDPTLKVDLLLGREATALDASNKRVELDDGGSLPYDGLVLATGATPRQPFPGANSLAGVHTLRTIDDCLALGADLGPSRRIAIIGAGFIGAEVAATCRGLGAEVTLIDVFTEPMLRVLGPTMGRVLASLHARHGVQMEFGRAVSGFVGEERVEGVLLGSGEKIPADVALIAIGVVPNTSWLVGSAAQLGDGVLCDSNCFVEGIDDAVAAGDVASWYHPVLGRTVRVEHWSNAVAQAQTAARNLLVRLRGSGEEHAFDALPYFWSDQYDWKLQFVGTPGAEVVVTDGSVDEERFVASYHSAGQLVGALCVNWPAQVPKQRSRVLAQAQ